MRILVVGDTHGDLPWVRSQVIPAAQEYNCPTIMQLGDFMFVWDNNMQTVEKKLARLSELLLVARTRLVFLPGNHENHRMLFELCRRRHQTPREKFWEVAPSIFYTGRVATWNWNGQVMFALGGATSIDRWDREPGESWWPEEQLTQDEAVLAKRMVRMQNLRGGQVDVLFSHDGPTNIPMNLIPDIDSEIHRQRITDVAKVLRPREWLHGHYHEYHQYLFPHKRGRTRVTSLACNNHPREYSMKVLELQEVT